MLRKLYYSLPVNLRYWARKVYYLPNDIFQKRAELVPPLGLIYTGSGDFEKQGKLWITFFKQHAKLSEQSNVLDIGSGIGRIAIPMTDFLKGEYHGFDAVRQGIDWCNDKIATKFKNFHFSYIDLFNDLYKNKGINAATFTFPYEQSQFDFACAISVFTHMIPVEVENYLAQSSIVLKKGGYFVATFFILDEESKALMKTNPAFDFKYEYENYALMDEDVKAANVGYDRIYLEQLIAASGFSIEHQEKGYWCGRKKTQPIGFQDIMVLRKI
jgi:SAM-dependent methyltransferase